MKNKKLKNLDSLIIVCAIFIVLGCRCQSSLFGNNRSSNNEINTNVTANTTDNTAPRPGRDVFGDNTNVNAPRRSPDNSQGGEVERGGGNGATADKLPASVGKYRLRDKEKGDPARDGFTGASEVWKAKYDGDRNETVQYAVAQFASSSAAEQNVRQTREDFRKRGGQVEISEVDTATDNDRNPIGVVFSMKGRGNLIYYWTSGKYVYAIIGTERGSEEFFAATETPLEP